MSVYHQMGHHSSNLVDLPQMSAYQGAVYSPINCLQADVAGQIAKVRESRPLFESILDPQLYVPASERGKLRQWSYFPTDVDTADLSSIQWWRKLNGALIKTGVEIEADAICSPVIIPKSFDQKFYAHSIKVGNELVSAAEHKELKVIQTVLCGMADLSEDARALEVASIVSGATASRIYLIFVSSSEPRRELTDPTELLAAMKLIYELEEGGQQVIVGFCSSDLALWKTAGATSCATGKFFNLRRFTRQRFEEPSGSGGGQLPYWFEEGSMAFARESDLVRLRKLDLLSEASLRNPFGKQILDILDQAEKSREKPTSWVGLGWRQFLYWFADVEARLSNGKVSAKALLRTADLNWAKMDDLDFLMEERHNTGAWIRQWRNTLSEFQSYKASAK